MCGIPPFVVKIPKMRGKSLAAKGLLLLSHVVDPRSSLQLSLVHVREVLS